MTTEKDHVRLGGDPGLAAVRCTRERLPVRLVIEERDQFRQMVAEALKRR